MSSLQGLPPLPRSLSGFNLSGGRSESGEPPPPPTRSSSKSQRGGKTSVQSSSRPSPPARQLTTLDTQLAVLRREMVFIAGIVFSGTLSFSFVRAPSRATASLLRSRKRARSPPAKRAAKYSRRHGQWAREDIRMRVPALRLILENARRFSLRNIPLRCLC